MDLYEGFIVGIFNYCDYWCQTCAFTSRCRVFADVARTEASFDPNLNGVIEAPPIDEDLPPPPPRWMAELIDEMNDAARAAANDMARGKCKADEPTLPPQHLAIDARASGYGDDVYVAARTRILR